MVPGMLKGQIQTDDGGQIPTLGSIIWWNVGGVEVSRDWFKNKLDEVGLDGEKYAKDHNYRATFLRCLKNLEEQRIIRRVKETEDKLIFQFTAERVVDDVEDPHLEYKREAIVEVDKGIYCDDGCFAESLTKCDDALKPILVAMFDKERKTYRSSDITRYVQKIFKDQADIVSLRQQGSIYFVPAAYQPLVEQVAKVLNDIPVGSAQLEFFPVPDVQSARNMVSHGVESEVLEVFTKMEEEIKKMQAGSNDISDKWVEHRQTVIKQIQKRLSAYNEVLGDTAEKLNGKFNLLKSMLKPRTIEV